MGLEELAGKRCKRQIKTPVNKCVKKVNAKIKPGLVAVSLGLNAPGILSRGKAPSLSTTTAGATRAAGGDLEGEKGTFWGTGAGRRSQTPADHQARRMGKP